MDGSPSSARTRSLIILHRFTGGRRPQTEEGSQRKGRLLSTRSGGVTRPVAVSTVEGLGIARKCDTIRWTRVPGRGFAGIPMPRRMTMTRRAIMRIELSPHAKELLTEICQRNGMTQVAAMSRITEWFAGQSELIQSVVLRHYPKEIEADAARLILRRLTANSKEDGAGTADSVKTRRGA